MVTFSLQNNHLKAPLTSFLLNNLPPYIFPTESPVMSIIVWARPIIVKYSLWNRNIISFLGFSQVWAAHSPNYRAPWVFWRCWSKGMEFKQRERERETSIIHALQCCFQNITAPSASLWLMLYSCITFPLNSLVSSIDLHVYLGVWHLGHILFQTLVSLSSHQWLCLYFTNSFEYSPHLWLCLSWHTFFFFLSLMSRKVFFPFKTTSL